jgi:hypothetical protein
MIETKIQTVKVGTLDIRVDNLAEQGIRTKKDLVDKYKKASFKVNTDEVWNAIKGFIKKDK